MENQLKLTFVKIISSMVSVFQDRKYVNFKYYITAVSFVQVFSGYLFNVFIKTAVDGTRT